MGRARNHDKEVTFIPINRIRLIKNSRVHPEREIEELCRSIEHYGFTNPLLVAKPELTLIAGYARYEAAKRLKMEQVPVLLLDLKPEEYLAYSILDNRLSDMGSWDYTSLIEQIMAVEEEIPIGFTENEIADLKHFQEEAHSSLDLDDYIEKKPISTNAGPQAEIVEILLTMGMEEWSSVRSELEGELASLVLKIPGLKISQPKVKVKKRKT